MSFAFHEACICGRVFAQLNAFHKHKGSCQASKKRLSSALEQAQEVWLKNKKPRFANRDKVLGRADSYLMAHDNSSQAAASYPSQAGASRLSNDSEAPVSDPAAPIPPPQQLGDALTQPQVIMSLY